MQKGYKYILTRSFLGGFSNSINRLILVNLVLYPYIFIRSLFIFICSLFLFKKQRNLIQDFSIIKRNKTLQFQILISSILGVTSLLLFYSGLLLLPVNLVSIIENGLSTVFVIFLSIVILKEKLPKQSYIFLPVCLIGLILIITKGNFNLLQVSFIGLLSLILSSFLSSFSMFLSAIILKKISIKTLTSINSITVILTTIPMMMIFNQTFLDLIKGLTLPIIIFSIILMFNSFFIEYFQGRSIQELNLSKTKIFTLLTPVLSAFFAMFIFEEWFNVYQYIGMFLVIISMYKLK